MINQKDIMEVYNNQKKVKIKNGNDTQDKSDKDDNFQERIDSNVKQ